MTVPNAGSPLRQRMIDDVVARKLAPGTQRGHVFACKQFAACLGRSPETATPDDVRGFQRHLTDKLASRASVAWADHVAPRGRRLWRIGQ